jgi:hypothetical protein
MTNEGPIELWIESDSMRFIVGLQEDLPDGVRFHLVPISSTRALGARTKFVSAILILASNVSSSMLGNFLYDKIKKDDGAHHRVNGKKLPTSPDDLRAFIEEEIRIHEREAAKKKAKKRKKKRNGQVKSHSTKPPEE